MDFATGIQQMIVVVIGLLLTVLSGILVAETPTLIALGKVWVESKVNEARSHLTAQQLAIVDLVVQRAVQEAEQWATKNDLANVGQQKLDRATQTIQDQLNQLGIPFNLVDVSKRIEAAINQGWEQPAASPDLPLPGAPNVPTPASPL